MKSSPEQKLSNFWYMMQILATSRTLEGSDEWAFRRITREYSQKFHVPLKEVRTMPFGDVLLEVLESRMDGMGRSDLMELVRSVISDADADEKALMERMRRYEEEEKARLEKQKTKKPKVKKQRVVSNVVKEPDRLTPVVSRKYSMGDPDRE